MCRWLAYAGSPVYLDEVLFKPANSLISQSLHARKSHVVTNGDGFGLGWYDAKAEPGLYRDVRPAWNDDNLRSLSEQIRSNMFFAHVRASTGTSTSRANCHPFRHGRWLFMHNGQIGGFDRIARELDFMIAPELYRQRQGNTDSETLFFLLLTFGLERDPAAAFRHAVERIEGAMAEAGVTDPLRIAAAVTDGEHIVALRHSTDRQSPTLYHGMATGIRGADGQTCCVSETGSLFVSSEPLDAEIRNWTAVAESSLLIAETGKVEVQPFRS